MSSESTRTPVRRHTSRGFTLVEVLVAIAILAFVTMLLYGAFAGMRSSRVGLQRVQDRYREGRIAITRISRDLTSAYISSHIPINTAIQVTKTAFIAKAGTPADRLDFNAFSNIVRDRDSHTSDQAEISYMSSVNPEEPDKTDLVRRISEYPDVMPDKGGRVEVLATDIDLLNFEFLDPTTSLWTETWDTTQAAGQPNRLPLQVRVTLVLRGGERTASDRGRGMLRFVTTVTLPIQQPLNFATL
jgi:general secretion pathway protein J